MDMDAPSDLHESGIDLLPLDDVQHLANSIKLASEASIARIGELLPPPHSLYVLTCWMFDFLSDQNVSDHVVPKRRQDVAHLVERYDLKELAELVMRCFAQRDFTEVMRIREL